MVFINGLYLVFAISYLLEILLLSQFREVFCPLSLFDATIVINAEQYRSTVLPFERVLPH